MSFKDVIEKAGYKFKRPFAGDTSGRWERLFFNDEKRDSGRYIYTQEGDKAIATFGSDKDPAGWQTWRSWDGLSLSDADYSQRMAWARKKEAEIKKAQEKKAERLVERLTKIYPKLPAAPENHGYLLTKFITPEQCKYRKRKDCLVIPVVRLSDSSITGLQYITTKGSKWFMRGSVISGGVCPLKKSKESAEKLVIAEGYATGAAIRRATKLPVFVAFNSGNMPAAARAVRDKYPDAHIIIAADNDQFTPKEKGGNVGVKKAQQAATQVGGFMLKPDFENTKGEPTDWDDYARLYGDESVKNIFSALKIKQTQESSPSAPAQVPLAGDTPAPSQPKHMKIDASNWGAQMRWKDGAEGYLLEPKYSVHNAILRLTFDPKWKGTFVYDEFQCCERVLKPLPWDDEKEFKWRSIRDTDKTQLRAMLSLDNINIGSNGEMGNVLQAVAQAATIHPVRAYFNKLEWDGVPRLDDWAVNYIGAVEQDRRYVSAVSRCWLMAAVKRVYEPAAEFHHMLVLEGGQAAGKSSFLKQMATFNNHSYFTDNVTFAMLAKPLDIATVMSGCLIIEFAEMTGKSSADNQRVKQWITLTHDEFVPKFSNEVVRQPRQCVFAASTNDSAYLTDPTGGRRFWPIKVGKIDHESFEKVKEQIWAEAIARYKKGELHYIDPKDPVYELMQVEQAQRYDESPWKILIQHYLKEHNITSISTAKIMRDVLVIPQERWGNKQYQSGIGDVMRELGYENKSKWDSAINKAVRKWVIE